MKTLPAHLLAFSAMLLPAAAQDIRAGLVSYWPLDEVSVDGLTTPDKAPLHTDLTLVNMSSANVVPGMRGNGMSFDGASQLMFADTSTGANPGLPLQNNVRKTICLWIKADGSAQQDKRFFAEASMATNTPMFNMGTDSAASGRTGKIDIYVRSDANAATVNHAKSVGAPLDNTWHHLALTDDQCCGAGCHGAAGLAHPLGRPRRQPIHQATGTAPFTYQWKRNGDSVPTGTGATLLLDPAQAADSGSYVCTVTNSAGTDTSSPATLLVRPITNLDSGRLSAWPLDAGDPTTPDTLSSHDVTLTNFAPELPWQAGLKNNAARFDGVNDFLVHPWSGTGTDSALSTREEFTIAFWARGNANGQLDRRVIAEVSVINTNPLFNLGTDIAGATDKLNVFIRSDTGVVPVNHLASNAGVFDGFWHHVIYTDYRGQMQLFVDGLPDATVTYARPVSTFSNFSIGAIDRAAPSHWFNGSVDEVNTWERALSTDEAAALYLSQPKPEPTLDLSATVARRRFYRVYIP